jgi:hypothetical protein
MAAGSPGENGRNETRPSRITRCAWCGRVKVDGSWRRVPAEFVAREREHFGITDGICPDCFRRVAPPRLDRGAE